jgi:hypothetical protein
VSKFNNPLAAPTAGQAPAPPSTSATLRPPQLDGNQTTAPPKPTKGPLNSRQASPNNYNSSGLENAMGALADKMHRPKLRPRR